MTDEELLNKVKKGLGITGTYQDETLTIYIEDVKNFLVDAGVSEEIVNGSDSVGVIIRGVSDLWNYGMGSAEFSEYFVQRATQLIYKNVPKSIVVMTVKSTEGSDVGTTKITVQDGSPDAIYRYSFTDLLPEYEQDLSDWVEWDGISDIIAEDGHKICVAEVTTEKLAIKAGITTIVANLG